jgi:hypothetical protein
MKLRRKLQHVKTKIRNTYRVLLWKCQLKLNAMIKQCINMSEKDDCETFWI